MLFEEVRLDEPVVITKFLGMPICQGIQLELQSLRRIAGLTLFQMGTGFQSLGVLYKRQTSTSVSTAEAALVTMTSAV
eukprot:4673302-Amphidinium_carterae.2